MLWLVLFVFLVLAIGGGIIISKFLFLLLLAVLIVAVFSSATPSAMARVFQAYRCQYAMLLDMNALEHTYFAFNRANGPALTVEYLMTGMREVDTNNSAGAGPLVRFIGYPDNRDFFYVMRRDEDRGRP